MRSQTQEFHAAAWLVSQLLDVNQDITVSVFEANIRVVGGLLSAHMLLLQDLAAGRGDPVGKDQVGRATTHRRYLQRWLTFSPLTYHPALISFHRTHGRVNHTTTNCFIWHMTLGADWWQHLTHPRDCPMVHST